MKDTIVYLIRHAETIDENGIRPRKEFIDLNSFVVLCQDNGHIKPLFFSKISKMHKLVAFIPRFA